uniref:Uncharacterized protein n=1 Tax=Onchocerca volvulus TaxID=6282 RepID=A0A8R1Y2Y4_ONCVO
MTVEKLLPIKFMVKIFLMNNFLKLLEIQFLVRRGRVDRPVYMKRRAVMIFNHDQKDITFSYDNYDTKLKIEFISQMPWSPPRGCSLRFISDTQNDEEMILEFENHGKLMEAFLLLKSKYLEKSQFVHLNELHSGRGLHTTTVEDTVERVAVNKISPVTVESRRSRVKNREITDIINCLIRQLRHIKPGD